MMNIYKKIAIKREYIIAFCVLISACMAYVMLRMYVPDKNSLPAFCSVCMDIICIIILFVLMGGVVFGNYNSNRTTRMFAILLLATIWAIFLDFINWAFDGSLEFYHLIYWFTVGSLCMGAVLACIFSAYLYSYMLETHRLYKMKKSAISCCIINMVSTVVSFVLAITGTAFRFVDGHYETGALYDVVTILPIVTLLYLIGYFIYYVKKVGIRDVCVVGGYILFMITGALIEAEFGIGTTYVAVAIADIFIFVMLQNEIIAMEKQNVQKWMKKSNTDELTGFYNRHAYENDIKNLESGNISEDFIYVSVDVNSLKVVNDSFGHIAGDELLIGAAECLEHSFGKYGNIYRIGGDEFICLIFASEEQLNRIKADINDFITHWSGERVKKIALSIGYVTKKEAKDMSVREMAVLADERMYEDKNEYYKRMGIDRRKK